MFAIIHDPSSRRAPVLVYLAYRAQPLFIYILCKVNNAGHVVENR